MATRNEIITGAYTLIGEYAPGESISSADLSDAASMLNDIVEELSADDIHLWRQELISFTPTSGTTSYTIGPQTTIYESTITSISASQLVDTAADFTVLGIVAGDTVTKLNATNPQSTTVVSVDDANTLTLTDDIFSAVSDQYRISRSERDVTTSQRLLTVDMSFLRVSNNDTRLVSLSRDEYLNLAAKSTTSRPNQFYYQPLTTYGVFYLFPTPDSTTMTVYVDGRFGIDNFDLADDTQDFPAEWVRFLKYALAVDLSNIYQVPDNIYQRIMLQYQKAYDIVASHDVENSSIYFTPSRLGK